MRPVLPLPSAQQDQGIAAMLNTTGNERCLSDPTKKCVPAQPKFRHTLRMTGKLAALFAVESKSP